MTARSDTERFTGNVGEEEVSTKNATQITSLVGNSPGITSSRQAG